MPRPFLHPMPGRVPQALLVSAAALVLLLAGCAPQAPAPEEPTPVPPRSTAPPEPRPEQVPRPPAPTEREPQPEEPERAPQPPPAPDKPSAELRPPAPAPPKPPAPPEPRRTLPGVYVLHKRVPALEGCRSQGAVTAEARPDPAHPAERRAGHALLLALVRRTEAQGGNALLLHDFERTFDSGRPPERLRGRAYHCAPAERGRVYDEAVEGQRLTVVEP